jgi:hypothetical protein
MLPFTLAAVHYHPQPVDDCPCFEDAIAVLAVVLGTFTGHWYWARQPFPALCFQRLYGEESVVKAIFVGFLRVVVGKLMSYFQFPILPADSRLPNRFSPSDQNLILRQSLTLRFEPHHPIRISHPPTRA